MAATIYMYIIMYNHVYYDPNEPYAYTIVALVGEVFSVLCLVS